MSVLHRYARFLLSPEDFLIFCQTSPGRAWRCTDNALPEDVRFVGCYYEAERLAFSVVVKSNTFAPVPFYEMIPIIPAPKFEIEDRG